MDIMINLNLWLAFVAASALLAFIPGPIVTLVIANSLSQGSRAGVINVLGTFSGSAVLFAIGGLGVAWIMTALSHWFDIVRWTLFAMVNAEELGVTSANVEATAKDTKNPDVARLLGTEGEFGKDLKLPKDWAVQIVKQVGNYGESFDRNVGAGSELKIERGLNALWNKGGLQYAPPVR